MKEKLMGTKKPSSKIIISISKLDNELFINGLCGKLGSVIQMSSLLKPEDLLVEDGGRAYLQATISGDLIFVDILRVRDNINIAHFILTNDEGTIEFDPWDRV